MTRKSLSSQLCMCAMMLSIFIVCHPSSASILRAWTLPELVEKSSMIVEGQITRIHSEFDANRRTIFTYLDIRHPPNGLLFDDPQRNVNLRRFGNTITLKLLGGTIGIVSPEGKTGKRTLVVIGNPSFTRGESVLIFLQPGRDADFDGFFRPVGMAQGKWRIATGMAKRHTKEATIIGAEQVERLDELPVGQLRGEIRQEIQRQNAEKQRRP